MELTEVGNWHKIGLKAFTLNSRQGSGGTKYWGEPKGGLVPSPNPSANLVSVWKGEKCDAAGRKGVVRDEESVY